MASSSNQGVISGITDPTALATYDYNAHGSFINHSSDHSICNVYFGTTDVGNKMYVVTSRAVEVGDQLFHDYGSKSWNHAHSNA